MPSSRIRIPFIRQVKRFTAFLLVLVYLPAVYVNLTNPSSLFFIFNILILLDYIWKTRRPSIDWKPDK